MSQDSVFNPIANTHQQRLPLSMLEDAPTEKPAEDQVQAPLASANPPASSGSGAAPGHSNFGGQGAGGTSGPGGTGDRSGAGGLGASPANAGGQPASQAVIIKKAALKVVRPPTAELANPPPRVADADDASPQAATLLPAPGRAQPVTREPGTTATGGDSRTYVVPSKTQSVQPGAMTAHESEKVNVADDATAAPVAPATRKSLGALVAGHESEAGAAVKPATPLPAPVNVAHRTVGSILREARENQRLTVTQVAEMTRIRLDYIKALENDDLEALPTARVYTKSYIKSLCRQYGLDSQPLLHLHDMILGGGSAEADASEPMVEPAATPSAPAAPKAEGPRRLPRMLAVALGSVLVIAAALVTTGIIRARMQAPAEVAASLAPIDMQDNDLEALRQPAMLPLSELPLPTHNP